MNKTSEIIPDKHFANCFGKILTINNVSSVRSRSTHKDQPVIHDLTYAYH